MLRLLLTTLLLSGTALAEVPRAVVRPAPRYSVGIRKPARGPDGYVDCNSPAHWDAGRLYMFFSEGEPYRSAGSDLMSLEREPQLTHYDNKANGGRWIEATWKDSDDKLYGWYHHEPRGVCPQKPGLTAPKIGAVVSNDNGMHWHDLGIILTAPTDSLVCSTPNKYFAGGNGDFSVIANRTGEYLYFWISTYNQDKAEQGVAVSRMLLADRDAPVGKVFKWHEKGWSEPGLGGHVTPVFAGDWHRPDASAFWGPSIHFNTHLGQFVILLNRAKDKDWQQEGVYVSFNPSLSEPDKWTPPEKIMGVRELEKSKWYPQVVGTDASAHETDKLAGRTARLFVAGVSKWEISFLKPGEGSPDSDSPRSRPSREDK